MCGVVGAVIIKPTEADLKQVVDVMLNMQIRGQHATGVSWVSNDRVNTIKESLPANEFWAQFDPEFMRNEDGNLYMIGHVRYSTSDLRYHQPIADDELAIVHNGVITQEPPETWEGTYGWQTTTSNDSELIHHAVRDLKPPLEYFRDSSMAVCELFYDKSVHAYRNHARPLAVDYTSNKIIFASTVDALQRSGINGAQMIPQYVEYSCSVNDNKIITSVESYPQIHEDLQATL